MGTQIHNATGYSDVVQATTVRHCCNFDGVGSAQLEVSADGGQNWLPADMPRVSHRPPGQLPPTFSQRLGNMVESEEASAGGERSWRYSVEIVSGVIHTHLEQVD